MFDETNNTEEQGIELPEKLFESETPEDAATNHGSEENETGDTIKIKYNGEERSITLDEAKTLAQKGMNYDHVVSERDTKYQRELQFLDKVAARQGMTRAQYIAAFENQTAEEVMPERKEDFNATTRAREQIKRLSEGIGLTGPWGNLFKTYPSLSRKEAFAELSDKVNSGFTPLEAYQAKLLAEKEKELRITANNGIAQAKSIGSLESDGAGKKRDEFLEGFFMDD